MTVPASLTDPALEPFWIVVRDRLEVRGADNRGRVRVPVLTSPARLALSGLLGRAPGATVDLAALEVALVSRAVGADLAGALVALGFPVSPGGDARRAARRARVASREAARDAVAGWPEPWAGQWVDEVIRAGLVAGLDPDEARTLVASVRTVIDGVAATEAVSRTDLAAQLLGSSHALDTGTTLEAAAVRALARADAGSSDDVWRRSGVHVDQVSGAVLTWALPVVSHSPLHPVVESATAAGIPLHLTQLALRRHPVEVAPGSVVLVAENPRVVEAAAQRQAAMPVVTTNGNPSVAVRLLLDQLLASGATLRYHGDFDVPGLAICTRMHRLGLQPWRMRAVDYRAAVDAATSAGVALPIETRRPGATPWDPTLAVAIGDVRRIVHEERLLDELLGAGAQSAP